MRQQTRTASQELGDLNQGSLSSGSPLLSVLQVTVHVFRLNQMIKSLDTQVITLEMTSTYLEDLIVL